ALRDKEFTSLGISPGDRSPGLFFFLQTPRYRIAADEFLARDCVRGGGTCVRGLVQLYSSGRLWFWQPRQHRLSARPLDLGGTCFHPTRTLNWESAPRRMPRNNCHRATAGAPTSI